jgi:ABC-type glycerol-3-phosphate transport system permease component
MRNVINSGIITLGTIAIVLCIICPAAYAFSKFKFAFSKTLYYLSILGMMIPSVVMLIPIMVLGKTLHLMNSLIGVILPLSALTAPFMLLILKNSIDDHPVELYEAAFVDGCSFFRMLFSIVVPMSKPTLLVIVLFIFMNGWNEYFLPLALLRSPQMMTVTVIPSRFAEEFGQDLPKIFAGSVMLVLPVVVVYLSIQRYFEAGFTTGAIKG